MLKTDLVGADVFPHLRAKLDPVRGYHPRLDLDALAALPPDTFGYAYARFLRENHLSPFVLTDATTPELAARNAFGIRYAITHDMFHVLLGYDTRWPGELGVLGFAVGQGYTPWQRLGAALAWLLYPLLSGFQLGALWRAWTRGVRLGRAAPFLLGVRLEDRMATPLTELRAELGLSAPLAAGSAWAA